MIFKRYFIKSPLVSVGSGEYRPGYKTYTQYNYSGSGIASFLKTWHFETALRLTKDLFHQANVIDFGCCDGPFLPSLSRYFNSVVGIDVNPDFIEIASKLCEELKIKNIRLICNDRMSMKNVKSQLTNKKYRIVFLLETLEHAGSRERMYESKIDFLKEILTLVEDKGIVVVSVPKMVGISFLIQRFGLKILGMDREPISPKEFLKSAFLCNTEELEKHWDGGHLGFNHKTLEQYLQKHFSVIRKKDIFFQVIYVIGSKNETSKTITD